jgi:hypothetical protein
MLTFEQQKSGLNYPPEDQQNKVRYKMFVKVTIHC